MSLQGIDVSNNNADPIPWGGHAFAFHKATEGTSFRDARYGARREQAKAAGLVWGAYHFAHPGGPGPAQQADYFLAAAQLGPGDLWALDLEVTDGIAPGVVSTWAAAFLDHVTAALGAKGLLYSYQSFLAGMPTANLVDRAHLWIADPNHADAPYLDRWPTWTIWQKGFQGGLDFDLFNGDLPALQALTISGGSPPGGAPAPQPAPTPQPPSEWSETMQSVPVHIPNLDGQGNGWVLVPGAANRVVSVKLNGADPVTNGYIGIARWASLADGADEKLVIEGGAPGGELDLTVWLAQSA